MLENASYIISSVADLFAGYALLEKEEFDLLILGVYEPELDAPEVLSHIFPTQLNIPVLFLTEVNLAPSISRKMLRMGQNYLAQPITPAKFLRSVAQILNEA
jgi:CheY-like chemotaxis protein